MLIYISYSEHSFYAKMLVSTYIFSQGRTPLTPFNDFEYFKNDMVPKDLITKANHEFVAVADELWTFGPISEGVYEEVKAALKNNKTIRHFSVGKTLEDIQEINPKELEFEDEVVENVPYRELENAFLKGKIE